MSLLQAARRSVVCYRSLRPFAPVTSFATSQNATIQARPFSFTPSKLSQEQEQDKGNAEAQIDQNDAASSTPPAENSALPWYLQVEPPTPQQDHPFSERQRLPALPPSPPPLLQPILEHVSVELGLDHLSLLDLRSLDPPPALGANLIMVIGTARSEKHLHVSADRLCRWLRSTHRLTPFADGLLGRNELKLKLRRKAKRSRMLSAVGAKETASGEVDDGIRTGWVCVNVGRVEGGSLNDEVAPEETEGFVGFGTRTDGCRIVVQMMTDEKRGLIDLETLWNGILRRSKKARGEEVPEVEVNVPKQPLPEPKLTEPTSDATQIYRPQPISSPSRQQARAYHSSARSTQNQQGAQYSKYKQPTSLSDSTSPSSVKQTVVTLDYLLDHLISMQPDSALQALGKDSADRDSTAFLKAFYSAIPRFPEAEHWHAHVVLRCHAVSLRHFGYTRYCMLNDLTNMRLACLTPFEETYMAVLRTLLTPALGLPDNIKERPASLRTLRRVFDILDNMHEDGYDPVSQEVLQLLSHATIHRSSEPSSTASVKYTTELETPLTLNQLLPAFFVHSMRRAVISYAWPSFWSMWRSYPQRYLSRSSDLYVMLFDIAAKKNNQKDAMNALRNAIPDMQREDPPVELEGELAGAVQRCVEVAEPGTAKMAREGGRGEWTMLWRRCARALGAT